MCNVQYFLNYTKKRSSKQDLINLININYQLGVYIIHKSSFAIIIKSKKEKKKWFGPINWNLSLNNDIKADINEELKNELQQLSFVNNDEFIYTELSNCTINAAKNMALTKD